MMMSWHINLSLIVNFLKQRSSKCFPPDVSVSRSRPVHDRAESGNMFAPNNCKWNAPRTGSRLKNNAIVRKQRGLIRAGGSSSSKASKHGSLDRLLIIFTLRHFRERFPKRYDPERHLGIFYAFLSVCELLLNSTSVLASFLPHSSSLSLTSLNMRACGSPKDSLWVCVMTKNISGVIRAKRLIKRWSCVFCLILSVSLSNTRKWDGTEIFWEYRHSPVS